MGVISYISIFNFYFLSNNNSNADRKNKYLQTDVDISAPDSSEFNYKGTHSHISKMTSLLL